MDIQNINPKPNRNWIESRNGVWYYPKEREYNRACGHTYYVAHSETVKPKLILDNLAKKGSVPQIVSVRKYPDDLTEKKIWEAFQTFSDNFKDSDKFPITQKKMIKLQQKICDSYIQKIACGV